LGFFQGLPAPILYDVFNLKSLNELLELIDPNALTFSDDTFNVKRFERNPDWWALYNNNLTKITDICLKTKNYASCQEMMEIFSKIQKNIPDLLELTLQPAHFDPTNDFNYPMIPFCWFDEPLNWQGTVNFTSEYDWYNNEVAKNNPGSLHTV
jgi:hypothetical protein